MWMLSRPGGFILSMKRVYEVGGQIRLELSLTVNLTALMCGGIYCTESR